MAPSDSMLHSPAYAPANVPIPLAELSDDRVDELMTPLELPAEKRRHVELRMSTAIGFGRFVLQQHQDPNHRAKLKKARTALAAKGARLLAELGQLTPWGRQELQFDLEALADSAGTPVSVLDDVERGIREMVNAFEASKTITYKPGPTEYGPLHLIMAMLKSTYEELAGRLATHWKDPEGIPGAEFKERSVAASAFGSFARILMQEIDPEFEEAQLKTLLDRTVWRQDRSGVAAKTASDS